MHYLLCNIPNPRSWTIDQVANIVSLMSTMATVYTIWYAYARNRKQDKKINDLAAIAQELKDQNTITKLQLRDMAAPKFIVKEGSLSGDIFWVSLFNEGNKAKLGRKIVKSLGVSFENSSGGIVLKNEELVFYGGINRSKIPSII